MLTANLYLIFITLIWGLTFPLIRVALVHVDPYLFVSTRFFLAALLLLPFIFRKLTNTNYRILGSSLLIGALNGITYISQTVGLQTIPASRSAFITGVSVILVPLFSPFFKLGALKIMDLFSSAICLAGLYILTGANLEKITTGDLWTLLCALSCALQIVYIQYVIPRVNQYQILTFYQLLFTIPLALIFTPFHTYPTLFYPNVLIALIFCSVFATTVAYFVQAKYQPQTTAAKAALIFSLEPVFATIFGYFLNEEIITFHTMVGGVLILFSLIAPSLPELCKKHLYKRTLT